MEISRLTETQDRIRRENEEHKDFLNLNEEIPKRPAQALHDQRDAMNAFIEERRKAREEAEKVTMGTEDEISTKAESQAREEAKQAREEAKQAREKEIQAKRDENLSVAELIVSAKRTGYKGDKKALMDLSPEEKTVIINSNEKNREIVKAEKKKQRQMEIQMKNAAKAEAEAKLKAEEDARKAKDKAIKAVEATRQAAEKQAQKEKTDKLEEARRIKAEQNDAKKTRRANPSGGKKRGTRKLKKTH